VQTGVFDGRLDALAAFLHGGIRQTDDGYAGLAVGVIDFDLDNDSIEADDSAGIDAGKHGGSLDEAGVDVNRFANLTEIPEKRLR
jgi:hypothetical protein